MNALEKRSWRFDHGCLLDARDKLKAELIAYLTEMGRSDAFAMPIDRADYTSIADSMLASIDNHRVAYPKEHVQEWFDQ